jgi:hypothetical protein
MIKLGAASLQAIKSTASGATSPEGVAEQVLNVQVDSIASAPLPVVTPGASSKVAFDASQQSAALTVTLVRLVSTTDCHLAFGANPTAVADGTCVFLPALTPEYFRFTSGQKVAAIKDAIAGNLFITAVA